MRFRVSTVLLTVLSFVATAVANNDCASSSQESEGMRCKKAAAAPQNCTQLTCDLGKVCVENAEGPTCVNNVFPSCSGVTCPSTGMQCVQIDIPARNLSVGQCFTQETADSYPVFGQFSCSSGFEICKPGTEACIESFEAGNFLTVVCAATGCSAQSPCAGFLLCIASPEYLQDSFASVCVAPTNFEFGNMTCDTFEKGCSQPGFACHDFTFEDQHIGTDCGPSATTFTASTCAELDCPTLLECYQRTIVGRGSLAQCAFRQSVDVIAENVTSLLDAASANSTAVTPNSAAVTPFAQLSYAAMMVILYMHACIHILH